MRNLINYTGDSVYARGVCFGGGGKKYKAPEDKSAEAAQIQATAAAEQDAREAERIKQANADAEAKRQADLVTQRNTFNTAQDTAITGARSRAQDYVTGRGLDRATFDPLIESEINRIKSGVVDLDPNVGQAYQGDIGAGVVNTEQQRRRDLYTSQTRPLFNTGWEDTYFKPTSDDAILNDIVGGQYNLVNEQLDRAKQRGQLNQTGFDAAMARLTGDRTAAEAQANTLGQGVIDRYTGDLRDVGTRALSAASNYNIGDTWDPNYWTGQKDTKIADLNSSFEGDIRSAIGNTQFFNPADYINVGGQTQGATTGPTDVAGILSNRTLKPKKDEGSAAWGSSTV